jgi:hypothetical protein
VVAVAPTLGPTIALVAKREHVRIIVGTAPGPRSGRWQIDTSDDDIYISHEGLRSDIHTSLHADGKNHHKISESAADRWMPNGDGYILKWGKPKEFAPGGRILFGIVIPTDHLLVPPEGPPLEKRERTILLEPAPPGQATVLSFVLIEPGRSPHGLPSEPIASFSLSTRGRLLVVPTYQPYVELKRAVDAVLPAMSAQFMAQFEGDWRPLPEGGDRMRAVLWTDPGDAGVPQTVEVAVEVRSGRSPYGRRRRPVAWLRRRLALT